MNKLENNNDLSNNDLSNNDLSNNNSSNIYLSITDLSNTNLSNNIIVEKKVSKSKYALIIVTFSLVCFEMMLAFRLEKLKDRAVIYLALYGQILLFYSLYLKNALLVEVSHLIFGICLVLVVFFSFNFILNIFCFIVLCITLFTRYFYDGCLFLNSLDNNISFLPDNFDFGIVYKSFFIIVIIKLFIIK